MFHKNKNIDTFRRCSQRRANKSLARIGREVLLEKVIANLWYGLN